MGRPDEASVGLVGPPDWCVAPGWRRERTERAARVDPVPDPSPAQRRGVHAASARYRSTWWVTASSSTTLVIFVRPRTVNCRNP